MRFTRSFVSLCAGVMSLLLVQELSHAAPNRIAESPMNPLTPDAMSARRGVGTPVPQAQADSGLVKQVDPSSITCTGNITFDDVSGGGAPGTNYDAIFESNGADFGERFMGQSLGFVGDNDMLSGSPSGALQLQVGAPGQNLNVFFYTSSQVLTGLGPNGFPSADAIGEGAFAVLFDFDQSEFSFELVGGNNGNAYVEFYRRDGSLVDAVTLTNLTDQTYAFQRAGAVRDIAGISIWNDDLAGIGFDNLCHDVQGVPGRPPVCDAGGPYTGFAGDSVSFNGSGSYDSDGNIVSYTWDFGDSSVAFGPFVSHTYADSGTYTVTLCVVDDDTLRSCCQTVAQVARPSNSDPDCSGAMAVGPQLWPPNHTMVSVTIAGITDPDGDAVTITVTGVTQDEPVNARGDGNTCPDAAIASDGSASVRSERSGTGDGRIYYLAFTATDGRGGSCDGSVSLCVPHDQGQGPNCVDSGLRINSLDCAKSPGHMAGEASSSTPASVRLRLLGRSGVVTTIEYALPAEGDVQLGVYDLAGRQVAALDQGRRTAGAHQISWNTAGLPNGMYFTRLRVGREVLSRSILLVR